MSRHIEHGFKRSLAALLRFFLRSRVAPPPGPDSVRRILVIRQHNQLGDMLCVVPLLRALRAKFPDAHIALMASPVNYRVMAKNRYVDEVILFDKREFLGRGISIRNLWRFIGGLRARHFDVAIVPSTVSMSFTSDLLAFLSGARCRIGAQSLQDRANPSAFFFTVPLVLDWKDTPGRHQTLRNLDCALPLGVVPGDLDLEMTLTAEELEAGRARLRTAKGGRRLAVGFHPGAGKEKNRWPAERFAELINTTAKEWNALPVVTVGPMDGDQVKLVENTLVVPAYMLVNEDIRGVASILAHLDLVVTNDTGVMHVAAAAGVPVLSIFGPTNPEQWAPPGDRNRFMVGRGGDITTLTVEEVLGNVRMMLNRICAGAEKPDVATLPKKE